MPNQRMGGWKTWTGAGLLGGATFLQAIGFPEFGQMAGQLGLTFLGVGIGHKIEKAARVAKENGSNFGGLGGGPGPAARKLT